MTRMKTINVFLWSNTIHYLVCRQVFGKGKLHNYPVNIGVGIQREYFLLNGVER
eukprot:CAMPEP_0201536662 /NCGR_PEP_ID=MMETSP0161_2-20130828/62504_1 /ASSEMBLY_ACC=CAM_ASM_000251 /TAXON_ID=180227 /ORGANISM="Neoparamoeba aestuarina, Strain SoJaBio B1-5/56/2" /LENGTH=53 /DNA_ID=CAMNT_0047942503 /DNA_START=383 /DNA_END=541 /DNA_ORIENTATION=+